MIRTLSLLSSLWLLACVAGTPQEVPDDRPDLSDIGDCPGWQAPDAVGFGGKVALTFDDGPHNDRTPTILSALRAFDVPATFFMLGSRVAGYRPDALEDSIAALDADPRFIVANHSWDHPNFEKLGVEEFEEQFTSTDAALRAAGADPVYFRFPYGRATCEQMERATELDAIVVGWHADSADWCYGKDAICGPSDWSTFEQVPPQDWDNMQERVLRQVRAMNGGIVLFHDIQSRTVEDLPNILQALVDEGFTFTGIDDIETFPLLQGESSGLPRQLASLGEWCEVDADCDYGQPAYNGVCSSAGRCTRPCQEACGEYACTVDKGLGFSVCRLE